MAAGLYAPRGVKMAHQQTGPVTRGYNVKSTDDESFNLISEYKPVPLPPPPLIRNDSVL